MVPCTSLKLVPIRPEDLPYLRGRHFQWVDTHTHCCVPSARSGVLSKSATSGANPSLLGAAVSSRKPRALSYRPGSPMPPGTPVPRPLARLHTDPPPTTGLPPPVPILHKQCHTRHLQQALLTTQGAQGDRG